MTSPAHKAAIAFLQGAMIAAVAQVVAAPVASALAFVPWFGAVVPGVRTAIAVGGFVLAGAVGGEAIGRRWAGGFAVGGALGGLVLALTGSNLQGLTGYENRLVVTSYAASTTAAAYGAWGLVAGAVAARPLAIRTGAVFAAFGGLGGLVGVVPFFLQPGGVAAEGAGLQFVWLVSAVGTIAVPLALGGASTAVAVERAPTSFPAPPRRDLE
jgi:hypothetical protein